MSTLVQHWPFFGLEIRTPRLTLRYLDDEQTSTLMELAATVGVHDPAFMPFGVPWTRFEPPYLQYQGMQHFWRMRAQLTPEAWDLTFAVYEGDEPVGVQGVAAEHFAVTKQVNTGSWLVRPRQGQGIGKEMRAAVLHLAFDGLGAQAAVTSAFVDNPASIGVTRSLGYEDNGWWTDNREGQPVRHRRFVLERERWQRRTDIEVTGLEPCLALLGAKDS